jgi:hypothetical protein
MRYWPAAVLKRPGLPLTRAEAQMNLALKPFQGQSGGSSGLRLAAIFPPTTVAPSAIQNEGFRARVVILVNAVRTLCSSGSNCSKRGCSPPKRAASTTFCASSN